MAIGPLTAADDDTEALETADDTDYASLGGMGADQGSMDALAAQYPGISPIRSGYESAIQRLKAERSGLSNREKLSALLIGFGQPTRHGTFGEGAANASRLLLEQSMEARKADRARQALIAKYEFEVGPKLVSGAAALANAKRMTETAATKPPSSRLGYARLLFPGLSDAELIKQGKLFSPEVDRKLLQFTSAQVEARENPEAADAVEAPTISSPAEGAKYPDSPMVKTPDGRLLNNPHYKGG